jgi:hypothetical protein
MDARTTGPSRGPGPIDRIADPGKATNGGSAVPEEKIRGLATSIDGWEKPKMKKKRSAITADMSSTGASRIADTEREMKQGQHKFNNDGRARMTSSPSFRSETWLLLARCFYSSTSVIDAEMFSLKAFLLNFNEIYLCDHDNWCTC